MTSIVQQKVLNGLLADDQQIQRGVAQAVSQLEAQTNLMLQVSAYLFTEVQDPASPIDAEYIQQVTDKFQAELVKLTAIMPKLAAIESLGANDVNGAPDPAARAANLASLISTYGANPATFADRYK